MTDDLPAHGDTARLLEIMRRLRDPQTGCPWDLEQDFATIAPYTIEEAYEVASAIEAGDYPALKDELGDLLLQVVFHAQMASEQNLFAFADVVEAICAKMIRRHAHVFGTSEVSGASGVSRAWEEIKRQERAQKPAGAAGLLDDIPSALPALMRAIKLQNRAAEVGFDWPNAVHVTDKIAEETKELAEAAESLSREKVLEEFGDLLFAVANLARHLKLDPEDALRRANAKFVRRFRVIEAGIQGQGRALSDATLGEMEALWDEAKRREKADQ